MPILQSSVVSRQSSEKEVTVNSGQWSVKKQLQSIFLSIHCSLSTVHSQRGVAQLAIVMLLVAGVAVGTYVVQNRTNIFPKAAEPGETSGCKRVSMSGRSERELSDGRLEITFTWGDGRTTYDYKTPKKADGDRSLIGAQSRGTLADGTTINKSGTEKRSGNTITQGWSDGSVEYKTVTQATNHQGISGGERIDVSHMMVPETRGGSCDGSRTTTSSRTTGTAPRTGATANPNPLSNQPRNGPDSKNTGSNTNAPAKITTTTPAAPATAATVPTSTATGASVLTQFQALKQIYDTTIAAKIASNSAILDAAATTELDQLMTKTSQSFTTGIQATQSCIASAATTCVAGLSPLLNYTYTLVRLTAFRAIFSDIPELCTRADFAIAPNITGTSSDGVTGPIYLCSGSNGKEKKWRIFDTNNIPHTLGTADAAVWLPLNDPASTAEFPQAFQTKFSEAVRLTSQAPAP